MIGNPWLLLAAVALDLTLGDPPNRWHPVAWMGWLIGRLRSRPSPLSPGGRGVRGRWRPLLCGAFIVIVGCTGCVAFGLLVLLLRDRAGWGGAIVEVIMLKMTFSVRGLASSASQVRRALAAGNLIDARRLLGWHLVSRDTAELDEARVAAAAVESVAENASDGVVAPWFFYLLAGIPAALAYRFVNTADAMLGYRDAEREWLGKFPARLDDVLNFVPARLTAVLILLAAPLFGQRWPAALRVWWNDAGKTASPNAGQPMAAAAATLGVELEKVGCYRLGIDLRPPSAGDVARAVRLLYAVAGLALILAMGAGAALAQYRRGETLTQYFQICSRRRQTSGQLPASPRRMDIPVRRGQGETTDKNVHPTVGEFGYECATAIGNYWTLTTTDCSVISRPTSEFPGRRLGRGRVLSRWRRC